MANLPESIHTTVADSRRHLNEVEMTYWRHACRSVALGAAFAMCALRATVHAIVPGWYTTASTDAILGGGLAEALKTA